MTATSEELDKLMTHAVTGLEGAAFSRALHRRAGDVEGERQATIAKNALESITSTLHALGATAGESPVKALSEDVPLALLDTPALRGLLASLESAMAFAEAVDAERGRALDTVVAGSAGLDLAEDLAQLTARVRLDLFGPSQRVTGGRE